MNTETKVHEYHLKTSNRAYGQTVAQEIYKRAYNAGKSDAIQAFVGRVKKDIGHMKFIGNNDFAIKREIEQVIDKRMKEALGDKRMKEALGNED